MIEVLLQAERALAAGLVDRAEGRYREAAARRYRAAAARRYRAAALAARLEEALTTRGDALPEREADA